MTCPRSNSRRSIPTCNECNLEIEYEYHEPQIISLVDHLTTLSTRTLHCIFSKGRMSAEGERLRIWSEAIQYSSRDYFDICLERLEGTMTEISQNRPCFDLNPKEASSNPLSFRCYNRISVNIVTWRLKAGIWPSAGRRFAEHIPLATRNRPLLDNGFWWTRIIVATDTQITTDSVLNIFWVYFI
jgi:hypothetical protein